MPSHRRQSRRQSRRRTPNGRDPRVGENAPAWPLSRTGRRIEAWPA